MKFTKRIALLLAVLTVVSLLAVTALAAEPLPSVTLTSAKAYGDGPVVRWNAVSGAAVYQIHRRESGGSWAHIATTGSVAYKDTTAQIGKTYYYTVLAQNGSRLSPWNANNSLKVFMGIGDVTMTGTQPHVTGNIVRWNPVDGAVFYQLLRREAGSNEWVLIVNTSGTAYKDTTAKVGVQYYYKARSRNGALMSSMNIAAVSATRPIGNVTMSSATAHATGNIVRWNAVEGATLYQVYRLASGESSWTLLTNTSGTAYKDTSAKVGVQYYYKVRARAGSAIGSLNITSVGAVRPPETVVLKSAAADNNGITVRWNATTGATMYQIFRKTSGGSWSHLAYTTGLAYKDSTAKPGMTYYYTVRAKAGSAVGGYNSTGISATMPTVDEMFLVDIVKAIEARYNASDYRVGLNNALNLLDKYASLTFSDADLDEICSAYIDCLAYESGTASDPISDQEYVMLDGIIFTGDVVSVLHDGWGVFNASSSLYSYYVGKQEAHMDLMDAYDAINDDFAQLETTWYYNSSNSHLYTYYTNNTPYTITSTIYFEFYNDDVLVSTSSSDDIYRLAPGAGVYVYAPVYSDFDGPFYIDWSFDSISYNGVSLTNSLNK